MTTKGFDAAMVCLEDARRHAVDGANHDLATSITGLLRKYDAPPKCRMCGQIIPAPTQQWYTQPCDAGSEKDRP